MGFFKNLTGNMASAKDYVVEKKKKTSLINKLRNAIRSEKLIADKAYLALGRYYYNNLRDESNSITESRCLEIEEAEKKIEQAKEHLSKIYNSENDETEKVRDEGKQDMCEIISDSIEENL